MVLNRRLKLALISGALLGLICIIGVGYRQGFTGNGIYILAVWYNRLVLGLVIGLAGNWLKSKFILRGLILGTIITSALYLSTNFRDLNAFFAGIIYGVIIDYIATKYS